MISFAQKHKSSSQPWHHLRLDARQLDAREHERVKMRFNRIYMEAHTPSDMSLWMAVDDDGANIYLSPQAAPIAADLIRRYQASPCDPPARSTVLVAGDGYGYGYGTSEPQVHAVSPRTALMSTTRRFLPARYTYRCVRSLLHDRNHGSPADTGGQMAPFVRRYAEAWDLSPPPRA